MVWLGLAIVSLPELGSRNGRYETKGISILYRLVVLILGRDGWLLGFNMNISGEMKKYIRGFKCLLLY